MDTFSEKVSLRYGNVEKEGTVKKARMKSHSQGGDPFVPMLFRKSDKNSNTSFREEEYLHLSYGKLSGYDEKGGNMLWSITMHEAKVSFDDKSNTITVSIPRTVKRELVRSMLREPYESKVTFITDDHKTWLKALEKSASANIEDFYSFGDEIGRGNFAVVYNGRDLKTNEEVAIKVMDKDKKSWQKFFVREMDILKCVNHPNVVRTLDIFDSSRKLYIVMEKMRGGKLFSLIVREKLFTEEACAEVMRDILQGLAYLHQHNIVHRDLKPDNILCMQKTRPYGCKLADFGLSNFIEEKSVNRVNDDMLFTSSVGTPLYVAPEIIQRHMYGPPIDIWAGGVIMYLMLSGKLPFKAKTKDELFKKVMECEVRFPDDYWHDISNEAKNLIRGLLQRDPHKRLPAGSALHHDWFQQSLPDKPIGYKHAQGDLSNHHLLDMKSAVRAVVLANRLAHAAEDIEQNRDSLF